MIQTIVFYLTSLLFSLGQLGRLSFNNNQINLYAYEIILPIILITLIYKYKFIAFREAFKKNKILFYFFGLLIIGYLFGIFNYNLNENLVSFLYLFRLTFYFIFFVYISFYIKSKALYKKLLTRSFYLFILIALITSVIQYFFYNDLRNLIYLGWDPHYNRLFGVFFDTSIASSLLGLILIFLYKQKKYFIALLAFICMILTYSRSSYLALVIVFIFDLLSQKNYRIKLSIFLLAIAIFLLAPKNFGVGVGLTRTFSISSRINDYKNALKIWNQYPVFGVGYNRIQYVKEKLNLLNKYEKYPLHSAASFSSSYLIILVSTGIIGLFLAILAQFKLVLINKKIFPYILFITLMSFTDNILLHPFILLILGVIILLSDK